MNVLPTLGGNIQRLRIAAGFDTQTALADTMGIQSQTISDWENDRRKKLDLKSMFRLAKALNCGLDDLVEGLDPDYDTLRSDLSGHGVPPKSAHAAATRLLEERHELLQTLQTIARLAVEGYENHQEDHGGSARADLPQPGPRESDRRSGGGSAG